MKKPLAEKYMPVPLAVGKKIKPRTLPLLTCCLLHFSFLNVAETPRIIPSIPKPNRTGRTEAEVVQSGEFELPEIMQSQQTQRMGRTEADRAAMHARAVLERAGREAGGRIHGDRRGGGGGHGGVVGRGDEDADNEDKPVRSSQMTEMSAPGKGLKRESSSRLREDFDESDEGLKGGGGGGVPPPRRRGSDRGGGGASPPPPSPPSSSRYRNGGGGGGGGDDDGGDGGVERESPLQQIEENYLDDADDDGATHVGNGGSDDDVVIQQLFAEVAKKIPLSTAEPPPTYAALLTRKGIYSDLNPSGKPPVIVIPSYKREAFEQWVNSVYGKNPDKVPFSPLLLSEASSFSQVVVRTFLLLGRGDWFTLHYVPFLSHLTVTFMRTHQLEGRDIFGGLFEHLAANLRLKPSGKSSLANLLKS